MSPLFPDIHQRFYGRILTHVTKMGCNSDHAEDVTQETFIRFSQKIDEMESLSDRAVASYLYTTASNIVIDYLRKTRGRNPAAPIILLSLDSSDIDGTVLEVEDSAPPVHHDLENDEYHQCLRLLVHDALKCLPDWQREVIVMHHVQGMDVKEISVRVGYPVGTVKSRLCRGRAEMAKRMGPSMKSLMNQ
jgi:RNA polymerase sigma-70 factor (ECF subfamily)